MAEGGRRELSKNSGQGSRRFSRLQRAVARFMNRVQSRQGSRQNVPSESIYEFAKDVEEDEESETPTGGAVTYDKEHIYAEIDDLYKTVREKKRLNLSTDLWDYPDIGRRADKLIKETKFEDAILLIQDYPPTQLQQLMMSECCLQLGKMRNAIKCIETLETLMKSLPHSLLGDLNKLTDEYIAAESYIRALILLSCLSKLLRLIQNPDLAVRSIGLCSYKCAWEVIPRMIKRKGRLCIIAKDLGLEMINDMLIQLRSVTGACSDSKVENEARCLAHIAHCYSILKNIQKSLELHRRGVAIMKKQFGVNASKYGVFGDLLNNIGINHADQGDYSEAYAFFSQALEVYNVAEDWPGDAEKRNFITKTKNQQLRAQRMLTK